ncbi:MAG TPA: pyruvate kinase [Vicinamibacteria bacterium]
MRRAKIVATIGPASRDPVVLERLLKAGVDVVRLNFSHGEAAEHLEVARTARAIAAAADRPLAILQDLSGPKIRTGRVAQPIELGTGETVLITTDESVEGRRGLISTSYDPLPRDVKPGDRILLDDGRIELRVTRIAGDQVECVVVFGGRLGSHKGMNLPGVALSAPALTDKDRRDLALGLQHDVDYVALSFVRQAADVEEAKRLIRALGGSAPLIAKIEKREAIEDLPSILDAADGVMVARGDLGVELSTEEVPTLQKRIIEMANGAGKVVITATQMLESMMDSPRPTRAEASDVANAILDGTDGIMLSGETAAGRFPVEAVETMARIAHYTEEHYGLRPPARVSGSQGTLVARSLARVANTVAEEIACKLIVAFTESGTTARLLSSYRPQAVIAALTYDDHTFRRLALCWGVLPIRTAFAPTSDEMVARGEELLKQKGLARAGDVVLMMAGHSHTRGATNMLRVHTIA